MALIIYFFDSLALSWFTFISALFWMINLLHRISWYLRIWIWHFSVHLGWHCVCLDIQSWGGVGTRLKLGGLRFVAINHAGVIFDEVLTPVGVGSIFGRPSYNFLGLTFKLAPLILPGIRLHALQLRVVNFYFSQISTVLSLLSGAGLAGAALEVRLFSFLLWSFLTNNFFHVLNFRFFILVIKAVVARTAAVVTVNHEFVAFAVDFGNHLVWLSNCRLSTILRANCSTWSSATVGGWGLWNWSHLLLILNVRDFQNLSSTLVWRLILAGYHPIRVGIGSDLRPVGSLRGGASPSCVLWVPIDSLKC